MIFDFTDGFENNALAILTIFLADPVIIRRNIVTFLAFPHASKRRQRAEVFYIRIHCVPLKFYLMFN